MDATAAAFSRSNGSAPTFEAQPVPLLPMPPAFSVRQVARLLQRRTRWVYTMAKASLKTGAPWPGTERRDLRVWRIRRDALVSWYASQLRISEENAYRDLAVYWPEVRRRHRM